MKRSRQVPSKGKTPYNICVLSTAVLLISWVMLCVLGSLKVSLTIDLWKVGLVLRPALWKEKCLDISNSTETQGIHLVGQGGTWRKQWATWPQHLVCMIGMQQYKYTNACQKFKQRRAYHQANLHHSTDPYSRIFFSPGVCNYMMGKWSHVCSAQFIVYRCFSTSITDGQRKERRPST